MFSTCFETKGSSSGRWLYIQVWYSMFYMLELQLIYCNFSIQNTLYHTCIYNRLLEDELSV